MSGLRTSIRYLRSGRLRRIPVDLITNEYAFSFGSSGWNYIRSIVGEHSRTPSIRLEDSAFFRFFQHDAVRAVRYLDDIIFLHDPARRDGVPDEAKFHLGTYPWGDHVAGGPWGHHFDLQTGHGTEDIYGEARNPWYRPGDPRPLEQEWEATLAVYRSLANGYSPVRNASVPEATLLVRSDGDYRAVRYNGQHRLATLAHLGRSRITVLVRSVASMNEELQAWHTVSSLPKVILPGEVIVREDEVDEWPHVRSGRCSRERALAIFGAFFELNGRERIEHLGVAPGY